MARNSNLRLMAAQMHALAAVRREIGKHNLSTGRKYLREFSSSFRRYDGVLTPEDLDRKIESADILLIGDYHALPASQRFAGELLERHAPSRRLVLGVEAVLARDQSILDAWWRREIEEEELRRRLRFDREWGYEWQPFYALLSTARDHADGLYGLDAISREDLRRIRSRDVHATAKIAEIRERHPGATIFVLFGESHMAPEHLPRALNRMLPGERVLTVLQNLDALYWQAAVEQAAIVSLGEQAVCVFNSSPLEKYESYRICLERWKLAADDGPDFAPAVYNLILSLARSIGFRLDSPRNDTQPRFLTDSLPEVVHSDTVLELEKARQLEETGCVYVPDTNTLLIREFRVPHAAQEAARFLHFAARGMTPTCAQAKPIEDALAHFGAKLLCPSFAADHRPEEALGESLYQAYLGGRMSRSRLRRIYLAHLEERRQAEELLEQLRRVSD